MAKRAIPDFDAERRKLDDKLRSLKAKKVETMGRLVIDTGADKLGPEVLAGLLLKAASADDKRKEAWREQGAAFLQRRGRKTPAGPDEA